MLPGSLTLDGIPFTLRREASLPYMKTRSGVFRRALRGQALVEYLLMTAMLLFLFTGMYKVLQTSLRKYFMAAGSAILTAYY